MVIATRMERMSRDADKRRSILASTVALLRSTEKKNEQRSETVFELVGKERMEDIAQKKKGIHRNENVRTSLVGRTHIIVRLQT